MKPRLGSEAAGGRGPLPEADVHLNRLQGPVFKTEAAALDTLADRLRQSDAKAHQAERLTNKKRDGYGTLSTQ